jgi:hypothetical protein
LCYPTAIVTGFLANSHRILDFAISDLIDIIYKDKIRGPLDSILATAFVHALSVHILGTGRIPFTNYQFSWISMKLR